MCLFCFRYLSNIVYECLSFFDYVLYHWSGIFLVQVYGQRWERNFGHGQGHVLGRNKSRY